MKAVELRIVFEDDDGKMYVRTYADMEAEVIFRLVRGIGSILREHFTGGGLPEGTLIGPVLRKVTEVEGAVEGWIAEHGMHIPKPYTTFKSILPDEAAEPADPNKDYYLVTSKYRFRFDVTAVPVKP